MLRLFLPLYAIVGTTLAGIAMIVVLVMGHDTTQPIIYAVVIGAIIGFPATWIIAKKLMDLR